MQGGNQLHEAGEWELSGCNASEGIEPRNQPTSGESTVFMSWKTEFC